MIQNTAFLQNCEILLSRNIHTSKSRSKRVAKMSRNKALESAVGGGLGLIGLYTEEPNSFRKTTKLAVVNCFLLFIFREKSLKRI